MIIALDLLLNRRRKIHIVPSGFSVKGSMMCLTQSLWYIYFKFNIFLIFCTLAFLILLYQYTCKEFPSLYYKKVKLPKKSTTVKAFWYCDWQLWIGLFHTGFSVISLYVHLMRKHIYKFIPDTLQIQWKPSWLNKSYLAILVAVIFGGYRRAACNKSNQAKNKQ